MTRGRVISAFHHGFDRFGRNVNADVPAVHDLKGDPAMARKSFVLFTGAVGVAAVVAGAVVSRRRRNHAGAAAPARPVAGAADSARRFATEWHRDDVLNDEFGPANRDESVAAH
jgi:hypothetical protein